MAWEVAGNQVGAATSRHGTTHGEGTSTVQVGPPRPWYAPSYSLLRDAGGVRAPGATSLAVAERPYSPPVWDSGLFEVQPAVVLGGPGDMAELSPVQSTPETAAPGVQPRRAEGVVEARPVLQQLTWEQQMEQEEAEVFTLHPWGRRWKTRAQQQCYPLLPPSPSLHCNLSIWQMQPDRSGKRTTRRTPSFLTCWGRAPRHIHV